MDDFIFDYDNKDFLYQTDDDFAIGKDGHIVQKGGDHLGMDLETGEFHITSQWNSSDESADPFGVATDFDGGSSFDDF